MPYKVNEVSTAIKERLLRAMSTTFDHYRPVGRKAQARQRAIVMAARKAYAAKAER